MPNIPQAVKEAVGNLFRYKGQIEYLGRYNQKDAYIYGFSEPVIIGLPEVYLWDGVHCQTVFGEDAFKIINTFT